jgi:hypothetical protein
MDFSEALQALKAGERLTREGWNAPGQCVALEDTTRWPDSQMYPFMTVKTVSGKYATWVPSSTDLLADDWMIYETSEEATTEVLADPQIMADIEEVAAMTDAEVEEKLIEAKQLVEDMRMRRVANAVESYLDGWRESIAPATDGDHWQIRLRGERHEDRDRLLAIEIEPWKPVDQATVDQVMAGLHGMADIEEDGVDIRLARLADVVTAVTGDPGHPLNPLRAGAPDAAGE